MSGHPVGYAWHAIGESVRGAAPIRDDQVHQDGIDWYPRNARASGPPLIMVLSDGHGSSKCFRSDLGAQFAIKSAKDVIKQFLASDVSQADL
ncbi:MAG: protein phosphatase 2C domain-containing protein, partial [Chloroflexota bacterium]